MFLVKTVILEKFYSKSVATEDGEENLSGMKPNRVSVETKICFLSSRRFIFRSHVSFIKQKLPEGPWPASRPDGAVIIQQRNTIWKNTLPHTAAAAEKELLLTRAGRRWNSALLAQ